MKSGWALSIRGEQQQARAFMRSRALYLVICSHPWTKFSNLHNLNKAIMDQNGMTSLGSSSSKRKRMFGSASSSCASSWLPVDISSSSILLGRRAGTCPSCSPWPTYRECSDNARTSACTAWSRRMRTESTRLRRSRQVSSVHHGASLMSCRCAATTRTSINT